MEDIEENKCDPAYSVLGKFIAQERMHPAIRIAVAGNLPQDLSESGYLHQGKCPFGFAVRQPWNSQTTSDDSTQTNPVDQAGISIGGNVASGPPKTPQAQTDPSGMHMHRVCRKCCHSPQLQMCRGGLIFKVCILQIRRGRRMQFGSKKYGFWSWRVTAGIETRSVEKILALLTDPGA